MEKKHLFTSIINLDYLQLMFDSFNRLTNVPITLMSPDGEVVVKNDNTYLGAGWQRACTEFHRKNKLSAKNCTISDAYLSRQLIEGENHALYKCLNGMVDLVVPIKYNDQLIANLFSGQFFLKKPSLEFFKQNAKRYGYDEEEYITAVNEIEIFSKEKVKTIVNYLTSIALLVTDWLEKSDIENIANERSQIIKNIVDKSEKTNEIITSTILSMESFIYSLDNEDCFEDFITPFKVGFFGESISDLCGKHYSLIFNKRFQSKFKRALENTKKCGESTKFMFTTEDSNNKYYHATVARRVDRLNNIIGNTLHVKEVTEEIENIYKVEKLTVAAEQSPVSIVITDLKGNIEYVNNHFVGITGYTKEEAIGKKPNILKSGCQNRAFYNELWSTVLSGETWKGELVNKRKDGTLFWENSKISPVIIDGSIKYIVAIKADITEQKKMEKSLMNYKKRLEERIVTKTKILKKTEYNFKELVEHLHGIVWEIDLDGFIKYVSPNVYKYLKTTEKQIVGCHLRCVFSNEELKYKADNFINNLKKRPFEFKDEEVNMHTSEGLLYFINSGKPIYDSSNNVVGFRGILIDNTQQKERDKHVVEAIWQAEEKQKSFLSMELHDSIGSSLSAASIYMNTAMQLYKGDVAIEKVNQIIKDTAREVRLIARQIRPPELEKLGLEGGLNNLKQLYESYESVEIDLNFPCINVLLTPQLELAVYRIVAELINNSLNHGKANKIDITVFEHQGLLYILFEDNGIGGIDVQEDSYRTGMGISNIYSRVKAFNGQCNFFSMPNQGLIVGIQMECICISNKT